eukprot:1640129-Prymnesium_polylepis.2
MATSVVDCATARGSTVRERQTAQPQRAPLLHAKDSRSTLRIERRPFTIRYQLHTYHRADDKLIAAQRQSDAWWQIQRGRAIRRRSADGSTQLAHAGHQKKAVGRRGQRWHLRRCGGKKRGQRSIVGRDV